MGIPGAKEFWARVYQREEKELSGVFQNQEENLLSRIY